MATPTPSLDEEPQPPHSSGNVQHRPRWPSPTPRDGLATARTATPRRTPMPAPPRAHRRSPHRTGMTGRSLLARTPFWPSHPSAVTHLIVSSCRRLWTMPTPPKTRHCTAAGPRQTRRSTTPPAMLQSSSSHPTSMDLAQPEPHRDEMRRTSRLRTPLRRALAGQKATQPRSFACLRAPPSHGAPATEIAVGSRRTRSPP